MKNQIILLIIFCSLSLPLQAIFAQDLPSRSQKTYLNLSIDPFILYVLWKEENMLNFDIDLSLTFVPQFEVGTRNVVVTRANQTMNISTFYLRYIFTEGNSWFVSSGYGVFHEFTENKEKSVLRKGAAPFVDTGFIWRYENDFFQKVHVMLNPEFTLRVFYQLGWTFASGSS